MTRAEFDRALAAAAAPSHMPPPLLALWHDARGDWRAAHEVAQDIDDEVGSWIHAYLHRKEGDDGNAGYWYRRARRAAFRGSLQEEWQAIVQAVTSQERS